MFSGLKDVPPSTWENSVAVTCFENEAAMQKWLHEAMANADGLGELIVGEEELENQVDGLLAKKLQASFTRALAALHITEIISANEDISLEPQDVLRPDFLLYSVEAEAIVVVELKNINIPTRQAGTEISAYAAEVRTYLPFIADADVIGVIVSNHWPTLLRHYVVEEVFWRNRRLVCLEPEDTGDGIMLRMKSVEEISTDIIEFRPAENHLGGYQICLYDDTLYEGAETKLPEFEAQMKSALQFMAVTGTTLGSHGFAFLWRDHWEHSLAPYSITACNIAPFQSVERYLYELTDKEELTGLPRRLAQLLVDHDPGGQPQSFSELTNAPFALLSPFCTPQFEGYTNWGQLREMMKGRAELVSFQTWGVFTDFWFEHLKQEYLNGRTSLPVDDPTEGMKMLQQVIAPSMGNVDWAYVLDLPED